jgi:putative addiction module CopG family antidote
MVEISISIPDDLAAYVLAKVASGLYEDPDEVVRDALLRMEEEDIVETELTETTAEELLSRLSAEQTAGIREKVLEGIADLEAGRYTEYEGVEGFAQLSADVKTRGRVRQRERLLQTKA